MTVFRQSHHFTDELLSGKDCRRTIGNWINYATPTGIWSSSDPAVEDALSPPPNWSGAYDFLYGSRRAPLQVHVGDSTDAANTALIGMRLSNRPDCWMNMKATNVNTVPMTVDRVNRTVSWVDLWDQSDLTYTIGRSRVEKMILLKAPGHPAQFRFALRLPNGSTHNVSNNVLSVLDAQGVEWLRSGVPWARDANGNSIRVSLTVGAPITVGLNTYPTIRLIPDAIDLASAVYPVELDPTATISGTTSIEDALLYSGGADNNYGGATYWSPQTTIINTLIRCASTALPAGTISALRFYAYYIDALASGIISAYKITAANTWVEGTVDGATQAGSCDWTHCVHATQTWAGSAGCNTSGTDYVADAAPPNWSGSGIGYKQWTLLAPWATDWRDTPTNNQGFVLIGGLGRTFISTEGAANQPYFEVDYMTGPSIPLLSSYYRRRRQ